jgi:hypothetical protein
VFPQYRRRAGCGFEQLELRLWRAPGLRAGFVVSSDQLILVFICSGPFAGMVPLPSGSYGRELRFQLFASLCLRLGRTSEQGEEAQVGQRRLRQGAGQQHGQSGLSRVLNR